MTAKLYTRLTKPEALGWLQRNDPEYDWASENLSLPELRGAIGDNLQSFGSKVQAAGLRVRFPLHGCDQDY